MKRVTKVTRLHLNKPQHFFWVPIFILSLVVVITIIISLILQRLGLNPANPEYAAGARQNMGVVWALPGFLVYLGVQAVSTTFPLAVALGTTRRAYVLGTAVANILQAAYIAAAMAILLLIEKATGHWFVNAYALDNYALGTGNVWVLTATGFLGVLSALSIGGIFGAIWVRFGSTGVMGLSLAIILVLVITLFILAPELVQIVTSITRPDLALAVIIIIVAALIGTWACMRRTSVR